MSESVSNQVFLARGIFLISLFNKNSSSSLDVSKLDTIFFLASKSESFLFLFSLISYKGVSSFVANDVSSFKKVNSFENLENSLLKVGGRVGDLMDVVQEAMDPQSPLGKDLSKKEKDLIIKSIIEDASVSACT